ncbi:MAG: sugar ABC transporter ATP-binding protein [Eubacteriales bacterium]|nr:sugar ABC transporter ATP-binding protein [Eubacteriales bacterium]
MSDGNVLLSFRHISKEFPGVKALKDISFDILRGEVHVLLGENGAGKSTLIKMLTGVNTPDTGTIVLNGKEIRPANIQEARALGIGVVFQENSLVPHLSVAENVFLTREFRDRLGAIDWKKTNTECERWLGELGLRINVRETVKNLSVAEQQIVEIVKILSQNPSLIVLDEPTSALSKNEIDNLFGIIRRLQQKGITFIYISHRMEEIQQIGDNASVLRDGEYIGYIPNVRSVGLDEVIKMIVGRKLDEKFPERHAAVGDVYFEAKGLSVPGTIYDISFSVREGEVVGLAGLVGAGRTSTAKAIIGVLPKSAGQIRVGGKEVRIHCPHDAIRAGIGYLPEDRKNEGLVLTKPIRENITMACLQNYIRRGIIRRKLEAKATETYREKLKIKMPNAERWVKFLSGGNQQKVVFAKWLCAGSKVYIFDEPTRGIDVGSKREIYQIINTLAEQGAAIVVISSELPEILGICDRVIVMHEGRKTGELNRADATQERIMYYAIGGKDDDK